MGYIKTNDDYYYFCQKQKEAGMTINKDSCNKSEALREFLEEARQKVYITTKSPLMGFFSPGKLMATLRELIIKISANSQSFQSEISRASRMGQDYYRTMQNGGRQAAARESERALSDLTAGFASAGRAAAAATAAFATGKLVQIADEWNSVNARLKQASSSADDFAASQRQLMEISQRTGTAFSDNANLFHAQLLQCVSLGIALTKF
jgi:hypothetical protein